MSLLPGFLAPGLLLGGLAVLVPLVLHFFYKARYRKQPWAAMRFLKLSIEQTSRRLRFQELILLALRCLALLLLAFALARPTWNAISGGGRGESIDAVFVFDTSYSMGASDGEMSRIDRAKIAALAVIDNLPPNSTVQILTCADRTIHLGPLTPGNLDQARQVVNAVQLTSLAGDILPGLVEADSALDRGAGSNKEVYLFTDLQKTGWDRQSAAIRAKAAELRQRSTLIVVRCGNPEKAITNVALVDLTYPGGIPHTKSRLPVTILVKNTGKNPAKNLTVTLEVDGRSNEKETATIDEIAAGQTLPITLTAKLEEAGARLLTANVQSDDLPGDNRLHRLIPVRDTIRILVVDGTPDWRDPKQSGSHFVQNALLPIPSDQQADYHIQVTAVAAEDAGAGLLGVHDICFLCNVPATNTDRPGTPGLSPEFVSRLSAFVKEGGGLIVGAGENIEPQSYNATLGSRGTRLLPFDFDEPKTAPADEPYKAAPDSVESLSFLARFRDEPFSTVTLDADFTKVIGIRESERSGGRVLMRLANQLPWITTRLVGEGEVIVVGSSFDTSWGNWPAKAGSYLSFLQLTLSHLASKATRGFNRQAGETLTWHPTEASKGFELIRPDQTRVKLGKATGGENGEKLSVNATDTAQAGLYRFALEGDDLPSGPVFTVAPDLRETENLDALTDPEAEEILGFKLVLMLAGPDTSRELTTERSRREWTVWVLVLLFCVAVGEAFGAWFCGKSW